ncbi:MAG: flagellar motor protein MotA [Micavibrio sp.]|nr:flagellar motor protein MotA [Micavibrio sp.]
MRKKQGPTKVFMPPRASSQLYSFESPKPPLSRAAVAGCFMAAVVIIGAIMIGTKSWLAFFSLEGLLIVVGGSIVASYMSFHSGDVKKALGSIGQMFHEPLSAHENLHQDMQTVISWARIVQSKGMRGLEEEVGEITDPFINYSLNIVVSNYSADDVRVMMETAADAYYERDTIPAQILGAMAGHAPAFGMVGTLVGMIIMLCNFNNDMSGMGAGLAVAFLSTLYGVVTARMVFIPAASKVMQQQDNVRFRNHLLTEGMVMLVAGKSPHYIHDRLNSFLRPEINDIFEATAQDRLLHRRNLARMAG